MFKLFSAKKKQSSIQKNEGEDILYRDMKMLSETAIGFVELKANSDIYQYIGKQLKNMVGDCIVFLNEYIESKKAMRFVDVFGIDDQKKNIQRILQFDPYKTEFPMTNREIENLLKKSLVYVEEGIYELMTKKIPKYFSRGIEKMFKITDVYIMGFSWEQKLYGNAVVLLKNNQKIRQEAIEAYLHQAAVSLRRRDSDIALQKTLDQLEYKVSERTKDLERTASDLEKFKLAVENTSDQVIITDLSGKILYANEAASKITGYKRDEIIGKRPSLWGDKIKDTYYQNVFKKVMEEKETFKGELNNKRKDGQKYVADLRIDPVLDPRGEVIFYVGIERDITREKKVDQAKTEFVSLASHQLRTPLSAINWYIELILDNKSGLSQKQKNYLNEVYNASKRMGKLVDSFLNVSRIELGSFIVTPTNISFKSVISDSLKELDQSISFKKLKISKIFKAGANKYYGDRKLVKIIITNLLSNAVKYTPAGGKITISVSNNSSWFVLKVKDNGYGIPRDQRDKMFTKLFRADNVRKKVSEGTGLGLYLVKSIIDEVGGNISFNSELNKGTEFIVKLPLQGMKRRQGTKELINI